MKNSQNIQKNKLSVIIPVHNGAKFLKNTVNGILKQNYKNLELILVENASQDILYYYVIIFRKRILGL